MIKFIFWFAAAVALGVAVLLPNVESRLLGPINDSDARRLDLNWNDEFHPDADVMVDAQVDWNDEFHLDEDILVDAQIDFNDDFHMDPPPPEPETIQLICSYVPCIDLNPDERHLDLQWNDEFHPSLSDSFCPAQLDLPEENVRHLALDWNDEFHPMPGGIYCLIPEADASSLQLACSYMQCEDLDPDERHLDMDWNDEFHPILSESFCPTEIDLGQEGILCLVPTPEPN